MRPALLVAVLAALPVALTAQQAAATAKPVMPAGWMVRPDDPRADMTKVTFQPMSRGWHVTTGSVHAIFYRPESTATGNYTVTLDAFLFGPPGEYPEGYGIFVGGKDLTAANQQYLYFVIANDGRFLIKRRNGTATAIVSDWKASPAIKKVAAGDKGSVENVLVVQARKDSVLFSVNGVVVAGRPRSELNTDGTVGFRINHGLSVHIAALTVAQGK